MQKKKKKKKERGFYTFWDWIPTNKKTLNGRTSIHGENYKPSTLHFANSLVNIKGECWTPPVEDVEGFGHVGINGFFYCLEYAKRGPEKFFKWQKKEELHLQSKFPWLASFSILSPNDLEWICHSYDVQVDVYSNREIRETIGGELKCGREIFLAYRFGNEYCSWRVGLYYDQYRTSHGQSWLLLVPDKWGHLPFVSKKRCNACGKWIKDAYSEHIRMCLRCACGRAYFRTSDHNLHCNKPNFRVKNQKEKCRIYKAEEGKFDISNCYFADFETLINEHQIHVPYACHYANHRDQYSPNLWVGKLSLTSFMEHILEHVNGVIWFYNGGRFDCFFIVRWCIENKIKLDERMMVSGTDITSFTIPTKRGQVIFKDLYKFMTFSLKKECKNFDVPKHLRKGDFDHNKIKGWRDVEEHKQEMIRYLRQDVLALRALYIKYAEACWINYKLNVSKFFTKSQLAYAAWTSGLDASLAKGVISQPIELLRTKKEDEDKMRLLYKGGRVLCGRPYWRCDSYEEIIKDTCPNYQQFFKKDGTLKSTEMWDEVEAPTYENLKDFLVYIDCNSLYPAAQKGHTYPHGKYKIRSVEANSRDERELLESLNERPKELKTKRFFHKKSRQSRMTKVTWKEFWQVSCAKVDVICPKDLSIGFLMSRNEEGVTQDLEDKKEYWYTGPELWEASKLGYKFVKIHFIMTWSKQDPMFDDWVEIVYARKAANENNASLRAEAKLALNALTGKFGQLGVDEVVRFYYEGEEIKETISELSRLEDQNGILLGHFAHVVQERDHAPYPIHLSAFILGNSKVIMSKVIRKMSPYRSPDGETKQQKEIRRGKETKEEKIRRMKGGYLELKHAPIYSDTDSLIVHHSMYELLPAEMKGKLLGQFKDELKTAVSECKIIEVTILAPKNYLYTYLKKQKDPHGSGYTYQLKSVFKAKGIPHITDEYNTLDDYEAPENLETKTREIMEFFEKRRKDKSLQKPYAENVDICERVYVFRELIPTLNKKGKEIKVPGKIVHISTRIPPRRIPAIVRGEQSLEAVFGCMVRVFGHGQQIYIANDYKVRTVNKNNWWNKGHRICLPPSAEDPFPTALPLGHQLVPQQSQELRKKRRYQSQKQQAWRAQKKKRDQVKIESYFQDEGWIENPNWD